MRAKQQEKRSFLKKLKGWLRPATTPGSPRYRGPAFIVDATYPGGIHQFWWTLAHQPPYLNVSDECLGPFDSVEKARLSLTVNYPFCNDVQTVSRHHSEETQMLWSQLRRTCHISFSLPLDEFLERIPVGPYRLGKSMGPERQALIEELEASFLYTGSELVVRDVGIEHLTIKRVLGNREDEARFEFDCTLYMDGPADIPSEELEQFGSAHVSLGELNTEATETSFYISRKDPYPA